MLYETNASPADAMRSEVGSPKKSPHPSSLTDISPGLDADMAALVARAKQSAARHAKAHGAMPEAEIAAVEQELLGATAPPPKVAAQAMPTKAKFPVRRAKKPLNRTALNEHVIQEALRQLQVRMSPQSVRAWLGDMRAMDVSAEDLAYAVWTVQYQRGHKKRYIRDPWAYAQRVLVAQARAPAAP